MPDSDTQTEKRLRMTKRVSHCPLAKIERSPLLCILNYDILRKVRAVWIDLVFVASFSNDIACLKACSVIAGTIIRKGSATSYSLHPENIE